MFVRSVIAALVLICVAVSCKKSSSSTPAAPDKPRVGTVWTYRYKTFDGAGVVSSTNNISIKATAEQTLGGESWISLDSAGTTNWYKLSLKSDGLYQYANGASYLLCKDPATLNQTYTGYNNAYTNPGKDTLTVLGSGISLDAPINTVTVNYYEGNKMGNVVEKIWYNSKYWIVKKETYILNSISPTPFWHIDKRWELTAVTF